MIIVTGLINRDDAVRVLMAQAKATKRATSTMHVSVFYESAACLIRQLPAVDAKPVQHGRWIHHDDDIMPWNECSYCGFQTFDANVMSYCPNCGVKMDGSDVN